MALKIGLKVTLTGWYRKSARLMAALRAIPHILIGPKDALNLAKARASMKRGDETYPLTGDARGKAAAIFARGMKDVADAKEQHLQSAAEKAGQGLAVDVADAIRGGQVTGPARSPAWIAEKGNDTNMVGKTRRFVEAITYKLVGRGSRRGGIRRAA